MRPDRVPAHLFIVFGGTGDLMRRKLLPALYHLSKQDLLGPNFQLLGIARDPDLDDAAYHTWAREALEEAGLGEAPDRKDWCDCRLHYLPIGTGDAEAFGRVRRKIEEIEREHELPENRVFYLALPPQVFSSTVEGLGEAGLNQSGGWTRLVVEKPFGRDLASARSLNSLVHRHFDEGQIYRIDHYLGKETVQNLLVFRFANPVFESLWNRSLIKSVQITVAEDVGVGTRAGYYDRSGALRDMVQNHLSQLLTLTGMEAPPAFEADAIRDEKVKVLRSVTPLRPEDVVFGQYRDGKAPGNGADVAAYLDEDGVAPDSETETFVAARLNIANWRWEGVPFYLRTGKRLQKRLTQIVVTFRKPPVSLFQGFRNAHVHSNALVLTLQPDEGFDLCFEVKTPGQDVRLKTRNLEFRYAEAFGRLPDGYETLLYDVVTNDQTLFVRADEVETAWALFEPLLRAGVSVRPYEAGGWGPRDADQLLADRGDVWMTL